MNRHGAILSNLGFQEGLLAPLTSGVVAPLAQELWPQWVAADDRDETCGSAARHAIGEDVDPAEHVAASSIITLNACLGRLFEGVACHLGLFAGELCEALLASGIPLRHPSGVGGANPDAFANSYREKLLPGIMEEVDNQFVTPNMTASAAVLAKKSRGHGICYEFKDAFARELSRVRHDERADLSSILVSLFGVRSTMKPDIDQRLHGHGACTVASFIVQVVLALLGSSLPLATMSLLSGAGGHARLPLLGWSPLVSAVFISYAGLIAAAAKHQPAAPSMGMPDTRGYGAALSRATALRTEILGRALLSYIGENAIQFNLQSTLYALTRTVRKTGGVAQAQALASLAIGPTTSLLKLIEAEAPSSSGARTRSAAAQHGPGPSPGLPGDRAHHLTPEARRGRGSFSKWSPHALSGRAA